MTGDEVRGITFRRRFRGYDANQVDTWLTHVADLLDAGPPALPGAGRPVVPLARQPRFSVIVRGYDPYAVDHFCSVLASTAAAAGVPVQPEIPDEPPPHIRTRRQYAAHSRMEWQRFPNLPGTRLRRASRKIIDSHGQVLLTRTGRHLAPQLTLRTGQVLRANRAGGEVVTSSGEPVLWLHRYPSSQSEIAGMVLLPGQRHLTFQIRGTGVGNALMTAVNESGDAVLWYRRRTVREYEIVVSPDLNITAEVLCIIELTAGWLWAHFINTSGGGGG